MYPQPNEHGVYEAEYEIPIRLSKKKDPAYLATIGVCQIGLNQWATGLDVRFGESGFGSPITADNHSWSWDMAVRKAILHIKEGLIKPNAAAVNEAIELMNKFVESLPVLRIEDFKNTQEATMAKKKPEPAQAQPEPVQPVEEKFYFQKFKDGKSQVISLMNPLTEHGKKLISDEIDAGYTIAKVERAIYDAVLQNGGEDQNIAAPTAEEHAEVCKLIDYEPLIKKVVTCTKMFEQQFTPDEIKQKAMEFSQAAQKKADLEDELKSTTQYIKSQITEATATVNRISQELGRGKYSESVRCHWVMNEPSRGQKTLYRLDREPKEPVESTRMTASDKQLELDDIAARAGKTERTLEEKPITPITNQPYEGEMLSDAEVEKETGLNPSELNGDSEDGSDEDADAADNCPI